MFKVNNKDTRTTPLASFWYLSCLLWTYFTSCFSVSIVSFGKINAGWGFIYWLGIFIDWFKSSIIIRTHFIIVIWSWYDMEYRFSWSFRIAELDVECCPNNIFCRSKKGKPWRSCKGGLYGRNMMFLEEAVLIAFEV